jgi:uncharacterized protein DUF4336
VTTHGSTLERFADEVWVATRPLRVAALQLGTRMTVIRLPDGGLFVHSPVELDEPTRAAVDTLGPVRHLIAPNRFHHLFVQRWLEAYPDARAHAAPGLSEKRSDLTFHAVLDDTADAGWREVIDQRFLSGFPMMNEVAFRHRPSRTLIATDLLVRIGRDAPAMTRFGAWLFGGLEDGRGLKPEKLVIRDKARFRQEVEDVLAWDFDRVILAHGELVASGGREALRNHYRWLLG